MNIAFIEDEAEYLDQLAQICRLYEESRQVSLTVTRYQSGEAFLKTFTEEQYAVIFLDIYMDGMSGLELAKHIRAVDAHCLLVFCTTSIEHMPEAFGFHAFEYVTKPFTRQRIFQVLDDAARIVTPAPKYVTFMVNRQSISVFLSDIVSLATDGHYLDVTLKDDNTLRIRMTVSHFMELTDHDSRFLLVNRGIVLNADYIDDIRNGLCSMSNGTSFPVRSRDQQKIFQELQDYNFDKIRDTQRRLPGSNIQS